ncbi:MAG: hypothetical protein INH41_21800, partial [Myxococcaceae bacterium]|nr:hypothetical protein [Myxococcaceae bacterium]
MRATVYRNLDALSSIAGLALPYEAGVVGLVVVLGIAWLPIGPTMALAALLYVAIRLGNRGHHPGYLQDLLPTDRRNNPRNRGEGQEARWRRTWGRGCVGRRSRCVQ